jgi:hypothetical protein
MTNIEQTEILAVRVLLGTKAKLRQYGKKNKVKDISKVVRQFIDMGLLDGKKCSLEAVAGQIKGVGGEER